MAKRQGDLAVRDMPGKVRLNRNGKLRLGIDVFNTKDLTDDTIYMVKGMTLHRFEDRTATVCFLLKNDEGTLTEKAITNFEVVA